jgi:hypothetical protein
MKGGWPLIRFGHSSLIQITQDGRKDARISKNKQNAETSRQMFKIAQCRRG